MPPPSTPTTYSTTFSDISPITLPSPADTARTELASIAYPPRYAEATSYLRAVMAANEFSERAVKLTEDVIEMNPAHYTVWLYRMKCLKRLWGMDEENQGVAGERQREVEGGDEKVVRGVEEELRWLDGVSERNLKNYQIWHHRQSLVKLLPHLPDSEPSFITHILSFDTKNYHVWSYRQWLCTHFPHPLLTPLDPTDQTNPISQTRPASPTSPSIELTAVSRMIDQDIRNNSAWHHRYFICFGVEELQAVSDSAGGNRKDFFDQLSAQRKGEGEDGAGQGKAENAAFEAIVEREIEYAKEKIRMAPQNQSPWNYLRGVAKRAGMEVVEFSGFCEEFIGEDGDLWTLHHGQNVEGGGGSGSTVKNEDVVAGASGSVPGSQGEGSATIRRGVRSSHAIELLSEIYMAQGDKQRCKECLMALSELWDPIRRNYWMWKGKQWGLDMDSEDSQEVGVGRGEAGMEIRTKGRDVDAVGA